MSTIKELRLEAGLSIDELSRLANVNRRTVERAEEGNAVQDVKAYAIITALGAKLNRKIYLQEVDDLVIL